MVKLEIFTQLMDKLFEFSSISGVNQNIPRTYGTTDVLYMAEVHLLRDINNMENATVTRLAESHRKSKSAMTQLVNKLEKKGLVKKCRNQGSRHIFLTPTEKGKLVAKYHDTLDAKEYSQLLMNLTDYTEEEFEKITRFIQIIIDGSEKAIKEKT